MKNITRSEIEGMNYTDFIAFIKETNRCPGGKDSVRKILQNSFIDSNSNVLEVGSNTGFTSLEIAHSIKCKVQGIDISESCVNESISRLDEDTEKIKKLVKFSVGSAYEIPFGDNSFDLVITGGATSFMDKKQTAVSEYKRIVKPWGFISVTQLFYITPPPAKVVDDVSNVIGVKINPWTEKDWLSVFTQEDNGLELYYYEKNELQSRETIVIDSYVEYFINKSHLRDFSDEIKDAIRIKWKYYINIFNENHKYLGYFIALFRKPLYKEEPELFIRKQND